VIASPKAAAHLCWRSIIAGCACWRSTSCATPLFFGKKSSAVRDTRESCRRTSGSWCLAVNKLRDPVIFWEKIVGCPRYKGKLPKDVWKLVHASLPLRTYDYELKSRIAGLGSLGHPRVLALAGWDGAHVVREAKQLTPSAWIWARNLERTEILSRKLVESAVRIRDPHVHFAEHWIVRRLAPDCCHIEISTLPERRDEEKLLYYMGWETANIHLGTPRAIPAVRRDIAGRKGRWLHQAAKAMLEVTLGDWELWRRKGAVRVSK